MSNQSQPNKTWVSNISQVNPEQAKEFVDRLLSNKDLFARLSDIVSSYRNENHFAKTDKKSYDSPSWAAYQADANGYDRACQQILNLLNFSKE